MSFTGQDNYFALVDCDNFYVSCERLFQPQYRNRPVVVLSNNDGCIVARSPEVKALGVTMAKPLHMVKDIIERHNVKVFSSNYTLYGDISGRVMTTLRSMVEEIDVYSIDEAFLYFRTSAPQKLAESIRQRVLKDVGIPVTIGIGATKTLSKVAAEYGKSAKTRAPVFNLMDHPNPDAVLEAVPSQDVWGIGSRISDWLYKSRINNARELRDMSDEKIRKKAGITGLRVVYELRGIPCIELRPVYAPRKHIVSSRSFGRYVTSLHDLEEAVASHATIAAEKLRVDGSVAGMISAFILTNPHRDTPQYNKRGSAPIHPPSNATHTLVKQALTALREIYREGYRYIKAGVALDDMTPASQQQGDLFAYRDIDKEERIYRAVDSINLTFGSNTIHPPSCGINRTWRTRRQHNSRRYTTKWEELVTVRL